MLRKDLSSTFTGHLGVPGLELYLLETWSSASPNHRSLVREALRATTGGDTSVLDLDRIPVLPQHSVSISHCKAVGGFVIGPKSAVIGFDVEVNNRLTGMKLSLVAHDSTELSEAPSLQAFWCIKEAAFKCLRGANQPRGLKDLRVGNWQFAASGPWSIYRCKIQRIDGRGVSGFTALSVDDGTLSYAICAKANS